MQVWSAVNHAFPSLDRRPGLDWDARVQAFLPGVMAAQDAETYYDTLMELVTELRSGHTFVTPPWGPIKPGWEAPPVELQAVEGRFLVARVADTEAMKAAGLRPGTEVLGVDGVRPFRAYFEAKVLRRFTGGSRQSDEAGHLVHALMGPKGSSVKLLVQDPGGPERSVVLTRNAAPGGGRPFLPRFMQWNFADRKLGVEHLDGGLVHVRIPNFRDPALAAEFERLVDGLDPASTKGMLIDVRFNTGKNSAVCDRMVACLVDRPARSPIFHFPVKVAARTAWGQPVTWQQHSYLVQPREGNRYMGPVVVLTGPATASTAEDLAIMLRGSNRARLVGEVTAGSSGNAYRVALPGGGNLRVATFRATLPDGTEYAELGLQPDMAVAPTREDLATGVDRVLQRGLDVLREAQGLRPSRSVSLPR